MAYVKILKIRSKGGIGRATNYVSNEEKTTINGIETGEEKDILKDAIGNLVNYASNEEKTKSLITGINCRPATAAEEMQATADYWKAQKPKTTNTRDAFHIIQSFDPKDNADPETIHKIGIEYAKSLQHMDDKTEDPNRHYKMLVCTHVDKEHLHNHIIICSYDIMNGKMFHECRDVYQMMRDKSDQLCREHGLSVIENPDPYRTHSRQEWEAAKAGVSWKENIRKDIVAFSRTTNNWDEFKSQMEKAGYEIKEGTHITYTDKEGKNVRDNTLGQEYTKEFINNFWEQKKEKEGRNETLDEAIGKSKVEKFYCDDETLQKSAKKKVRKNLYNPDGEPRNVLTMLLYIVLEMLVDTEVNLNPKEREINVSMPMKKRMSCIERGIETAKEMNIPDEETLNKRMREIGSAIGSARKEINRISNTIKNTEELDRALKTYKEEEGKEGNSLLLKEAKAKMYRSGCSTPEQIEDFISRRRGWEERIAVLQKDITEMNKEYKQLSNLKYTLNLAKEDGFINDIYYDPDKEKETAKEEARAEKEEKKRTEKEREDER